MSATLTKVLDLSASERAILKQGLSAQWTTACRFAQHAESLGNHRVADQYRTEADRIMDLAIKLGLGMLP